MAWCKTAHFIAPAFLVIAMCPSWTFPKEDIENSYTGDIQEEMKYFNRTAYVKEQLTVQFTELSDEEAENFSEQFVEKMFN